MPELSAALTAVVTELYKARGWSGRDLAREAGIKPTTLAGKLSDTSRWTVDEADAVARALGLRPDDLMAMAVRRRSDPSE